MVILYHCWIAAFSSQLDGGPGRAFVASFFIAVDMFFVISGFVLFLPTARDGKFGSVHAWRRVARICPAYYASLAGFVLLWPFIAAPGSPSFFQRDQLEALAIHAVFLQRELLATRPGSSASARRSASATTGRSGASPSRRSST